MLYIMPYRLRRWLIQRLVNYCVKRGTAKWIHLKGQLYLERYILRGGLAQAGDRVNVYLHRFHRPDDDRGLHNHPWDWSFSVILTGGYLETRRVADRTIHTKVYTVGNVNRIKSSDEFHRVAHLLDARSVLDRNDFEPEVWTLFVTGPKTGRSWGYLIDWVFTPKKSCGGCRGCVYGAVECDGDRNLGTEEIPIYFTE